MCRSGALFFGLILLLAAGARALDVRETLWGFDGRVVPGRMNPVSLLLANPGNSNFDGVAKLRETAGIGGQSGAPFVQPIFLGPQSERWVQFEVFVSMGYEDFVLTWGRGAKDEFNLPHPTLGPPARVLLGDPANPFAAGGSLKNFPDALFPTTVSATDALDGVVLDYAPRWEPARREAFVDWLRRGATVIVLPSTNGEFPQFTEQLAVLNIAGDSAHVGAGTVLRVRAARREAGERLFEEHGFPLLELAKPKAAIVYNLEQTLFSRLAQLTRPNLRWSLLSALTVLYILVIGPAHYRWGRRLDYRVSIGAFVGCVGIFGIVFAVVGRRGNGEEQTVHSLAIARPIEPGRHDVTQWVSAFATRGDIYALTHAAPSNLYAAVSNEPVNGQIMNGRGGQFIADIPLFSSRQFLHRAVMQGDDTSVTVEKWQDENSLLTALVLKTGAAFPREIVEAVARFQDRFYRLKKNGDRLTISDVEPGQRFEDFLPQKTVQQAMFSANPPAPGEDVSKKTDADLRAALPLLYVHALDGHDYFPQPINRGPQPADRLQLFIFAKAPEGFRMQGKGFAHELGYVLYVQEVFKPVSSPQR